ncbi:unnamed protein product [Miscanthus lutarioriparius]|uniref:Uncharacterized protein n=1 Tax=Miscanthus lutarioriparius TaxID=422564 RepID=A0A811SAA2_9POAL|nr:unnamed protein product [Miscanthus lutarioriparius]CAD6337742.1 unnamed protein product [Miscanthus lutarioriparius]
MAAAEKSWPLSKVTDGAHWDAEDIFGHLCIVADAAFLSAGFLPCDARPETTPWFERARGGGRINMGMGGQYSALAKLGLAVLTSNTAIDTYDARRDPVSAAFVFLSYAVLVILTAHFVRAFAHAHAGEPGQED